MPGSRSSRWRSTPKVGIITLGSASSYCSLCFFHFASNRVLKAQFATRRHRLDPEKSAHFRHNTLRHLPRQLSTLKFGVRCVQFLGAGALNRDLLWVGIHCLVWSCVLLGCLDADFRLSVLDGDLVFELLTVQSTALNDHTPLAG